jgi:hypothetical protein
MGRRVIYSGTRYYRRGTKRQSSSAQAYIGPNAFKMISILAIGVLLSLYILNVSKSNQSEAVIRGISDKKEQLVNQLDVLKAEEARNRTANETKKKAEGLGLTQGATELGVNQ